MIFGRKNWDLPKVQLYNSIFEVETILFWLQDLFYQKL